MDRKDANFSNLGPSLNDTPSANSSNRMDKHESSTVPLNLSADTVEEKRTKRSAPASEAEGSAEIGKRIKSEQTEATDLSMKPNSSGGSSQKHHSVMEKKFNLLFYFNEFLFNCVSFKIGAVWQWRRSHGKPTITA